MSEEEFKLAPLMPSESDLKKMEEIKEMYKNYPKTAEWMLKMELYYKKRKAERNV